MKVKKQRDTNSTLAAAVLQIYSTKKIAVVAPTLSPSVSQLPLRGFLRRRR